MSFYSIHSYFSLFRLYIAVVPLNYVVDLILKVNRLRAKSSYFYTLYRFSLFFIILI